MKRMKQSTCRLTQWLTPMSGRTCGTDVRNVASSNIALIVKRKTGSLDVKGKGPECHQGPMDNAEEIDVQAKEAAATKRIKGLSAERQRTWQPEPSAITVKNLDTLPETALSKEELAAELHTRTLWTEPRKSWKMTFSSLRTRKTCVFGLDTLGLKPSKRCSCQAALLFKLQLSLNRRRMTSLSTSSSKQRSRQRACSCSPRAEFWGAMDVQDEHLPRLPRTIVVNKAKIKAKMKKEYNRKELDLHPPTSADDPAIPPDLKRELYRIHRNLGHPDQQSFCRALKHAGVKEHIIRWVKKQFVCPICESRKKPASHPPSHLSRAVEFNHVVGVEMMFYNKKVLVNMLDWGTNYQIVEQVPDKTSEEVTQVFMNSWVAHYGNPQLVVCDQGTEFTGKPFAANAERVGDPDSLYGCTITLAEVKDREGGWHLQVWVGEGVS